MGAPESIDKEITTEQRIDQVLHGFRNVLTSLMRNMDEERQHAFLGVVRKRLGILYRVLDREAKPDESVKWRKELLFDIEQTSRWTTRSVPHLLNALKAENPNFTMKDLYEFVRSGDAARAPKVGQVALSAVREYLEENGFSFERDD